MPILRTSRLLPILLICAAVLSFSGPLSASMQIVEQAHELTMSHVLRWPLGNGDSLVFRRCEDCATQTLKISAISSYAFNGNESLTLDELLRIKTGIRRNQEHVIVVFYEPESRAITRLIIQTEF